MKAKMFLSSKKTRQSTKFLLYSAVKMVNNHFVGPLSVTVSTFGNLELDFWVTSKCKEEGRQIDMRSTFGNKSYNY